MPEKFEDNLGNWMKILSNILTMDLSSFGEIVKMNLFKCKGESLRATLLYVTKYKEDVENMITTFSQQIFEVCMKVTDTDPTNNKVMRIIKFNELIC